MPLWFMCPACGKRLQSPDTLAGRRGACHFCGARIIAPGASGGVATLAPSDPVDSGSAPTPGAIPSPAAAPPPWTPPAPSIALDFAPFWKRVLGFIADSVVLWLLFALLGPLFRALNPWPAPDLSSLLQQLTAISEGMSGMSPDMGGSLPDPMGIALSLAFALTWTSTVHWLYFALFESSALQATPGKRMLSVRVTDMRGGRIGFGQATMREVGRGFSSMLCFLGYLMAAFTEKRQALHDFLAQTLVLNR